MTTVNSPFILTNPLLPSFPSEKEKCSLETRTKKKETSIPVLHCIYFPVKTSFLPNIERTPTNQHLPCFPVRRKNALNITETPKFHFRVQMP